MDGFESFLSLVPMAALWIDLSPLLLLSLHLAAWAAFRLCGGWAPWRAARGSIAAWTKFTDDGLVRSLDFWSSRSRRWGRAWAGRIGLFMGPMGSEPQRGRLWACRAFVVATAGLRLAGFLLAVLPMALACGLPQAVLGSPGRIVEWMGVEGAAKAWGDRWEWCGTTLAWVCGLVFLRGPLGLATSALGAAGVASALLARRRGGDLGTGSAGSGRWSGLLGVNAFALAAGSLGVAGEENSKGSRADGRKAAAARARCVAGVEGGFGLWMRPELAVQAAHPLGLIAWCMVDGRYFCHGPFATPLSVVSTASRASGRSSADWARWVEAMAERRSIGEQARDPSLGQGAGLRGAGPASSRGRRL